MNDAVFTKRSRLPVSADEAFAWHKRPGALERLTPAWQRAEIVDRRGTINPGDWVRICVRLGPLRQRWLVEHHDTIEGRQFRDVQLKGPFERWEHTHIFEPDGSANCYLEDRITYRLRWGALGQLADRLLVRKTLERLFEYRHSLTLNDLQSFASHRDNPPMNILVSGSSGLIGSALLPLLTTSGHQVTRLVRKQPVGAGEIAWDPAAGTIDSGRLEGLDAVVHLAGENLAARRWTEKQKARLRDSRVRATRLLCEALAKLQRRPHTLIAASAIGYYGNRGDEILDEQSTAGQGFLAELCRDWEEATRPASESGLRVVHLRTGVVLDSAGGALAAMLTPFRLGLGGRLGSGRQYVSWIALEDQIRAIHHLLVNAAIRGPVNIVSPHAVTNQELTKTLGRVLKRPTIFPVPAIVARLAFGEMADEALLSSAHVRPARLVGSGFTFRLPQLEAALRHALGKPLPAGGA